MIESPVLIRLLAEQAHLMILAALRARFGSVPGDVVNALETITDGDKLLDLSGIAAQCPDLETFRRHLDS